MNLPHDSSEFEDAIEQLIAEVDDPAVEIQGAADSYHKCIEATVTAGDLIARYMAKRLGLTPLQLSMAQDRLYALQRQTRPRHHKETA